MLPSMVPHPFRIKKIPDRVFTKNIRKTETQQYVYLGTFLLTDVGTNIWHISKYSPVQSW